MFIKSSVPLAQQCYQYLSECFATMLCDFLYTQKSFTVLKRNNVYKTISSVVSRVLSIHIREILKQYIWICFKFPNALNYFKVNMVRKPQVLLLHECYQYLWYYKNIRRISFIYQNALYCLEANTI